MLVIMKYSGCRPISLMRCFSDAVQPSEIKLKLNRNTNFYVPILSEERKQVYCNQIVFLLLYLIR